MIRRRESIFLAVVGAVFLGFTVLFLFFPRPRYSELERRELTAFPELSLAKLKDGSYTGEVSAWFGDSQPFRDRFLTFSMTLRDLLAWHRDGDEQITVHQGVDIAAGLNLKSDNTETQADMADVETAIGKSGILIVGKAPQARALMTFSGGGGGGEMFARTANSYAEQLPGVRVYVMVIPTAHEFYCPPKARKAGSDQKATIDHLHSMLSDKVKPVEIHTTLKEHSSEDIYLRTDHHWAPLGAYYAARELARVAGVKVPDLSQFERHTVDGFVGTMYGYSGDIAVKNSPETFVYHTPKGVTYTTTYRTFSLDEEFHITGERGPYSGAFFHNLKGGAAYSTFMGGDCHIVKVTTSVKNGRKLLIMKDSFGNAVPGYLIGSFEEIHVADFRYFPRNIKEYVKQNGITDLAMCNNIFAAYGDGVSSNYRLMLTGKGTPIVSAADKKAKADTTAVVTPTVTDTITANPVSPEPMAEPEPAADE